MAQRARRTHLMPQQNQVRVSCRPAPRSPSSIPKISPPKSFFSPCNLHLPTSTKRSTAAPPSDAADLSYQLLQYHSLTRMHATSTVSRLHHEFNHASKPVHANVNAIIVVQVVVAQHRCLSQCGVAATAQTLQHPAPHKLAWLHITAMHVRAKTNLDV